MLIKSHLVRPSDYMQACFFGSERNEDLPVYAVIHDTAGRSATSTANYIATSGRKVSYHLIVGRDGTIIQQVPLNYVAYHAGVSQHPDKPWLKALNRCSIGIALDNPGELSRTNPYECTAWFGEKFLIGEVVKAERNGRKSWHLPYTQKQLATLEMLIQLIDQEYDLSGVLSHHEIAPTRKVDPAPTLDPVIAALSAQVEDHSEGFEFGERAIVSALGGLNLRREPHIKSDIIEVLPINAGLTVEPPVYPSGYVFVATDEGQSGYVHSNYLQGA